jgi:hypothetical protein
MKKLLEIGPKQNVMQIVPPRHVMRPSIRRGSDKPEAHDLIVHPLASPTGPGGAKGFRNRAGSTISQPQVMNVYLGTFWGDQQFVESFSKAIVENGYLDPLRGLGYGTGSGTYLGSTAGPALQPNSTFTDSDARKMLKQLLDEGVLHGDSDSLFVFILPDKVVSQLGNAKSCSDYCGYHDSVPFNGQDIAYAILPSPLCKGCGGEIGDFTAVYAHELAEATTDKIPGKGWVADDGQENGDLEAWVLFPWGPPDDPKRYTVQGYYTNERGNTIGAWRDTPAIAARTAASTALRECVPDPEEARKIVIDCVGHETDNDVKLGVLFPDDDVRSSFCDCVAKKAQISRPSVPCATDKTIGDVIDAITC